MWVKAKVLWLTCEHANKIISISDTLKVCRNTSVVSVFGGSILINFKDLNADILKPVRKFLLSVISAKKLQQR